MKKDLFPVLMLSVALMRAKVDRNMSVILYSTPWYLYVLMGVIVFKKINPPKHIYRSEQQTSLALGY